MVKLLLTEYDHTYGPFYIGVTPGSSHNLSLVYGSRDGQMGLYVVRCGTHNNMEWVVIPYPKAKGYLRFLNYTISWSPEINAHAPNRSDY